jgi:hypothetical protein
MERKLPTLRSHVLQQKAPPAARTHGNVSTTACVTSHRATFTADTAVLTRAGTHRAVPPTYAHMASLSRVLLGYMY